MTLTLTKREQAVLDCFEYSPRVSTTLLTYVIRGDLDYATFSSYASWGGIQGYPVVALWEEGRQMLNQTS